VVIAANILGALAVLTFVASYQMKKRRAIIALNALSRIFYVVQYILLGAFEGALLDGVAFFVSILCRRRDSGFVKKHLVASLIISNAVIVGFGMLGYKNLFSALPIIGVIFETAALWFKRERNIRIVSFFAVPFWLVYNLISAAYGSAVGNVITLVSISVAIVRYDVLKKEDKSRADLVEPKR